MHFFAARLVPLCFSRAADFPLPVLGSPDFASFVSCISLPQGREFSRRASPE
jgi:hypothetical protein